MVVNESTHVRDSFCQSLCVQLAACQTSKFQRVCESGQYHYVRMSSDSSDQPPKDELANTSSSGWLFYPHFLHLHFKTPLPATEVVIGRYYFVELCFSNEIDMYRTSDLDWRLFPIGLQV